MTIQIVTDSTAYLTREEMEKYDIKVVELKVNFQGEEKPEGFPGDYDRFFENLKTSKDFPVTSQPSPGAFAEVYQDAIDGGKEVITISLSSKISGTYNSAVLAKDLVDSEDITVVDSLTSSGNLKYMAIEARKMADSGKTREEIGEYLEDQKTRAVTFLTVETLDYLEKGGRLSSGQALIGSILDIKPILRLQAGQLEAIDKVRGKKKAMDKMIENIPKEVKFITVSHVASQEEAEKLRNRIQEKFAEVEIEISALGPVIGAHLGIGGIGIGFVW